MHGKPEKYSVSVTIVELIESKLGFELSAHKLYFEDISQFS